MNQEHKDLIRKNYIELTNDLKTGIEDVCKELWRKHIISKHMEEDIIEGERTGRRRAQALLDLIVTRGPYAFDALYEAAKENALLDACNILKPQQGSHFQPPVNKQQLSMMGYESDDDLPDRWPSDAITKSEPFRKIESTDTGLIQLFRKTLSPDQDSYYPMRHSPRGRCLIINNEHFINLEDRDGSHQDRKGLEMLLRGLDFDVNCLKDLKSQKMWEELNEEASKPEHEKADCFALFILSHGHTGVVFGTDGRIENNQAVNCVSIKSIRDLFCEVPALRGKPKLIFIQACQGTKKDSGLALGETSNDGTASNSDANTKDILRQLGPADKSDAVGERTGSQADVFIAMATTAEYLSWRNTKYGTWFIQAIVYVFSKYAYKRDLNKLMTLVNKLVGKAETFTGKFKQVGEKTDTFNRTFYFFPGLQEGM